MRRQQLLRVLDCRVLRILGGGRFFGVLIFEDKTIFFLVRLLLCKGGAFSSLAIVGYSKSEV